MDLKTKIRNYLLDGVSATQVATICGVSKGYVAQLAQDPAFREDFSKVQIESPRTEDERLENKYEATEHALLNRVLETVDEAGFTQATRGLEIIAKVRDTKLIRKNPGLLPATNINVIALSLPNQAVKNVPTVEFNQQKEIVGIGGQSFAPMTSGGVQHMFDAIRKAKENETSRVTTVEFNETPLKKQG